VEEALLARSRERKEETGTKVYVLLPSSCVPFNLPFSFGKMINRGPPESQIMFKVAVKVVQWRAEGLAQ
jgi:hypothetical protein